MVVGLIGPGGVVDERWPQVREVVGSVPAAKVVRNGTRRSLAYTRHFKGSG